MPAAVKLRDDYSADELQALAGRSKDANQSRRLLSLAAVRGGVGRGEAAKIGGTDRQTWRDWAHRFNASGPDRLVDNRAASCPTTRLPPEQSTEFANLAEAGPGRAAKSTPSCAGGASISSASSASAWASRITSARSESSSRSSDFRT